MDTEFLQKVKEEKIRFQKYLSKSGLKMTSTRKVVFDEVMHAHGHFAPEELHKQCRDNNRDVSRATIYRSLKELLAAGIIRETAFGEKHSHYEHVYDETLHHHARCIRCGHTLEVPCLNEEKQYQAIIENQGFQILGHELHFYGICEQCQL